MATNISERGEFLRSTLEYTPSSPIQTYHWWVEVKFLGQGSFGRVGLWCCRDLAGRIIDRVVCKESGTNDESDANDESDTSDHPISQMPREVYLHRLATLDQPINVVRYLSHTIRPEQNSYRLFMEYCPHGDLHDTIGRYMKRVQREDGSWEYQTDGYIPEPVLFALFLQMARGCMQVWKNIIDPDHDDRNQIVLGDIKPSNIFMGEPDAQEFPAHPVAKLGDFGGAAHTGPDDPRNPIDLVAMAHTSGWQGPENFNWDHSWDYPGLQRLGTLNVFQVGLVMRALMQLEAHRGQQDFREQQERSFEFDNMVFEYSEDLQGLVADCIRYDPGDRYDPDGLVKELEDPEKWKSRYTGVDKTKIPEKDREDCHWRGRLSDQYRIGLSMEYRALTGWGYRERSTSTSMPDPDWTCLRS